MSTTEDLNENLGPRIIATICSLVCLSTIFVAMRLYVRIRMIRARAIDDYVVVASLVSFHKFNLCSRVHPFGRQTNTLLSLRCYLASQLVLASFFIQQPTMRNTVTPDRHQTL